MLRGAERGYRYKRPASGELVVDGAEAVLYPGEIEAVSPSISDIHMVANAIPDKSSISIHVYGANISAVKRHTYDPLNGNPKNFVSGYSSQLVPNLWDRSAETRASL